MTSSKRTITTRFAGLLFGTLLLASACGGTEASCYKSLNSVPASTADFEAAAAELQATACSADADLQYSTSSAPLMCESDGEGGPWFCWTGGGGDCVKFAGIWWCGFQVQK